MSTTPPKSTPSSANPNAQGPGADAQQPSAEERIAEMQAQLDALTEKLERVQAKSKREAPRTPSPEEVREKTLEIGKVVRLRAVHGLIVHPTNVPVVFDTDRSVKVEVDRWIQVQYGAGKLEIDKD